MTRSTRGALPVTRPHLPGAAPPANLFPAGPSSVINIFMLPRLGPLPRGSLSTGGRIKAQCVRNAVLALFLMATARPRAASALSPLEQLLRRQRAGCCARTTRTTTTSTPTPEWPTTRSGARDLHATGATPEVPRKGGAGAGACSPRRRRRFPGRLQGREDVHVHRQAGLKSNDGSAVTAASFQRAIERSLSPKMGSPPARSRATSASCAAVGEGKAGA